MEPRFQQKIKATLSGDCVPICNAFHKQAFGDPEIAALQQIHSA
jgi:hypothetical protein